MTVIVHMQTAKVFQFQVIHQGLFKYWTGKDKDKDLKLVLKDSLRTRTRRRTRINITANGVLEPDLPSKFISDRI